MKTIIVVQQLWSSNVWNNHAFPHKKIISWVQVWLNKNKINWLSHNHYDMKNNNYCSDSVIQKPFLWRTNSREQAVWVYLQVPLAGCPLGTNRMSCHVCLCVSVWVSLWLTVSYCENQQVWTAGMCVVSVSCAYTSISVGWTAKSDTPGQNRQRERETGASRLSSTHNPAPWGGGNSRDWQLS